MTLSTLDFVIIGAYVVFALVVGSLFFNKAKQGATGFFVGDRKLPWWIAGTSIVATTFAADTPLAVAGIVGTSGIAGNWIWWCWAIAHLVATFFFARLWRRSGVITDAEITELRYSGSAAAKLRAFKAVYYGLFINCLTMAWVILAMVKISAAFFPDVHFGYVITACVVTSVIYTSLGGFRGVVVTDMVQFSLGMIGALALAYFAVSSFDGIGNLEKVERELASGSYNSASDSTTTAEGASLLQRLAETTIQNGKELAHSTDFIPDDDNPMIPTTFFIVLLIAGWWRSAEGNGYLVQRLAATKDEGHAQAASLWFSIAHNALRPWPWLLVGLTALIFYPNLSQRPAMEVQGKLYLEDETLNLKAWPAVFEKNDEPITIFFSGLSGYNCDAEFGGQFVKLTAAPEKNGVSVDKITFKSFNRDVFDPLRVDCQVGTGFFPGILVGEMPKKLSKTTKNKQGDEVTITVEPAALDVLQGGVLSFSAKGTALSEKCEVIVGTKKALLKKTEKEKDNALIFTATFKGDDDDVIKNTRFEPLVLTCGYEFFAMGKVRVELKDREMGYPLMMKRSLPAGWLGLVIASLLAAFMSTIDTHTNWGASYMVQDIYRRFFRKDASEAHYVMASRFSILGMAILAGIAATFISSIAAVWGFLITLGAGLGSVSAARWYWHRVTPHAEFAAMGVTTLLALSLEVFDTGIAAWQKVILVALVSFLTWIPVALFGPQNDEDTLKTFAEKVRPAGPGWKNYVQGEKDSLQGAFGRLLLGCVSVFAALFGIGKLLFGDVVLGAVFCGAAIGSLVLVLFLSKTTPTDSE
ncbi:MAG: hypothetical protein GY822_08600 [Deltaproteobacteria bacterium]|nr:hypothetical protein [Deltaproteobacteria bacterium]